MTTNDKLADALKLCRDIVADDLKEIGHDPSVGINSSHLIYALEAADEALAEHEATKAATSDDVREAVEMLQRHLRKNGGIAYGLEDWIETVCTAALRNTQGVPGEVVDALETALRAARIELATYNGNKSTPYIDRALAILDQHARGG